MSCMSDVDLATLHKTRLEERVHYKLSWWARRRLYIPTEETASTVPITTTSTTKTITTPSLSTTNTDNKQKHVKYSKNSSFLVNNSCYYNGHSINKNNNNTKDVKFENDGDDNMDESDQHTEEAESRLIENCSNDKDYFATLRRRRSGTWPRTRSLNAPSPSQQFGPCGRIMKNSAMVMQIQDPASQRLTWYKTPLAVLVIKKARDHTVLPPFIQLVDWLIHTKNMVVWVEEAVLDDPLLITDNQFRNIKDKVVTFRDDRDNLTDRIDFIVCLGGDGTLLYASSLFQQSVPPVMAFHLGSLGFLTPFQFTNFQEQVTNVLEGNATLTLRSRLRCIIVQKNQDRKDMLQNDTTPPEAMQKAHEMDGGCSPTGKPAANILVLNEVVIDRGPSPYLSNIDLFLDGKHITSVQGDGLIVSTPTGSTAYSGSAGGSMVHPSVPCIMVTPICPHSLSFRPIVVPAGVELKIAISPDSRNTSWVSFDGRNHQELLHGDSLRVTTSIYPVPSICAQDQISDWFDSLAECLHWNVRKSQKAFDDLERAVSDQHIS